MKVQAQLNSWLFLGQNSGLMEITNHGYFVKFPHSRKEIKLNVFAFSDDCKLPWNEKQ